MVSTGDDRGGSLVGQMHQDVLEPDRFGKTQKLLEPYEIGVSIYGSWQPVPVPCGTVRSGDGDFYPPPVDLLCNEFPDGEIKVIPLPR